MGFLALGEPYSGALRTLAHRPFVPFIRPWDESPHVVRWLLCDAFACGAAHGDREKSRSRMISGAAPTIPSFPRRQRTVPGVGRRAVSESQRGRFGKSLVGGARAPVQHDQRQ